VDYFIDTVFNYPTLAECYKAAAFNGVGRLHRYQSSQSSPVPSREVSHGQAQDGPGPTPSRRSGTIVSIALETPMTTSIGVVMTEHIVAGLHRPAGAAKAGGRTPPLPADPPNRRPRRPARQRAGRPAGQPDRPLSPPARSRSPPSASPSPASSATASSKTRPTCSRSKACAWPTRSPKVLQAQGITAPVHVANDADAVAAGLAATGGHLDKLTRVWTLGNGIGYGRWPYVEGVWEGGHTVVTLDPKERYCGCGGVGHLEGIMGNRAMRLRFLDLEPEEVFANAKAGRQRCREFVDLWHRALAAGTASFIHLAGPGRSTSPATTSASSSCPSCAATSNPWSR
jgi:glucokinase